MGTSPISHAVGCGILLQSMRCHFRVLCVDDEPTIRDVLELLLCRDGHAVETAPDGLAAWTKMAIDPNAFHLVVTDNEMPHLTGLGFVSRIRAHGFTGKVVMFSGSLTDRSAEQLKGLDVTAVVPKGKPVELLQRIRALAAI